MHWEGVIRHYSALLPPVPDDCVVTLLEGNTPLVPAPALASRIAPGTEIFLKCEGLNPTGSFK
ncbi:MAG TPA: pyridoxal-phosphate dependent enzyme, partial [Candidatus Limnocylindrales bacterium]|nr:pyridoxal-phosphate dependent enzyme [Candidatus Limnocylindrales bacterium]